MAGRVLLAVIFIGAGLLHFVLTPVYVSIMPDYMPAHKTLVLVSGAFEVLGGVGLLFGFSQRLAAWGLVALLVAVMPANVNMALHPERWPKVPGWALWARLPLQVPLVVWSWWYSRA